MQIYQRFLRIYLDFALQEQLERLVSTASTDPALYLHNYDENHDKKGK